MLEVQVMASALDLAAARAGKISPARTAMMAMTTSNSMSVNPADGVLIPGFPDLGSGNK